MTNELRPLSFEEYTAAESWLREMSDARDCVVKAAVKWRESSTMISLRPETMALNDAIDALIVLQRKR